MNTETMLITVNFSTYGLVYHNVYYNDNQICKAFIKEYTSLL